ncbi:MAG: ribonuclease R [Bacteroidota bacterium]
MAKKRGKKKKQAHGRQSKVRMGEVKDRLQSIFYEEPDTTFSYRQLVKKLGIRDAKTKDGVKELLFSMEAAGKLARNRDGRFYSVTKPKTIRGRVDHVNPRFAYIISEEYSEDIWVRSQDLKFAIDGDEVEVLVTKKSGRHFRPEGKVVNLVKRSKDEFVGRIEVSEKFAFVVPDNRNLHFDVFVYPEKAMKSRTNDKVIVKITKWHDRNNRSPMGEVIAHLGKAGEHEAEIHSIMAEFGLPFEFPDRIEKEAEQIPVAIDPKEIKYRRDFREVTTFTIDPFDAKDFDDALSIEKKANDQWEIGVHIADVSHYVKPDTLLEKEGYDRATSVYLVDRTIPMLPEKLSNGLCSLRPQEEKLTFSAVFKVNAQGKVLDRWFGRTIIFSDRRFTYEEAQERIESKEGDFQEEVNLLNDLAKLIREDRFKGGAVNFETVEVKFELAEDGKPLRVIPKERKDSHKMIEEWMLLANKEVATFIFNRKQGGKSNGESTFVYRTHDDPDPEKLDSFAQFAARFGHKLSAQGMISKNLNQLMGAIEGKPEQNVLEQLAIRSMAKAKYTTDPRGHFGLAFPHYTHFTSPIRRYPDVMVHRLLWHYLEGGKSPDRDEYEARCVHSSEREKRAAEAERASIKYKQVEFMQSMLGEPFDGLVSGVTEWGIFVEIVETKCEGMIRISDLEDDYYEFDEKQYAVIGRRSGRRITLGDALKVQVVRTDIDRRTIDLEMLREESPWQADDF